jgi:hypothetical protein
MGHVNIMWTSFEIVVGLGFIILFFVGLLSLARDLLQRNWYPSPPREGWDEHPRLTNAIPAKYASNDDAAVAPPVRSDLIRAKLP